ncbi:hypothetical protein ACQPYE_17985 [Actinosynnema sp. CA-299493]
MFDGSIMAMRISLYLDASRQDAHAVTPAGFASQVYHACMNALHAKHEDQLDQIEAILSQYRIGSRPLFMIGSLDKGVTIRSQQVRALNLIWALVHSKHVATCGSTPRSRIAIAGGGFAGLTAGAALLRKDVNADIAVFERCDTPIPLQHGCDTRWVHPHIYEWPLPGSEASSAALPVLNWTAGRASDVVVQVMKEWTATVQSHVQDHENVADHQRLSFYCNTTDFQVKEADDSSGFYVECTGDPRRPDEPWVPLNSERRKLVHEKYDMVILALGFGLEVPESRQSHTAALGKALKTSYWRNEQLGQPNLMQKRIKYIVSGAGDGALLDLFRLRITSFRQDRILSELFEGRKSLLTFFRTQEKLQKDRYESLDAAWHRDGGQLIAIGDLLKERLRHDTCVEWHNRYQDLSDVLRRKISFQNGVLIFLLDKISGFTWSREPDIEVLRWELRVDPANVIMRYGTKPGKTVNSVLLDDKLKKVVNQAVLDPRALRQDDTPHWSGGFFDFAGTCESKERHDSVRAHWRKEYLPGPTEAISTAFCSSIAGFLAKGHPGDKRLRVTMHRTLLIGDEAVLQQCCEYQGINLSTKPAMSSARTFPVNAGTIGVAYLTGKVVRTRANADKRDLRKDMQGRNLNDYSRTMAQEVASIAAIPMVSAIRKKKAVIGVLYADSYVENFFRNEQIAPMVEMIRGFMRTLERTSSVAAGTLVNSEFWQTMTMWPKMSGRFMPVEPLKSLEIGTVEEPLEHDIPYLNIDFASFPRVINYE